MAPGLPVPMSTLPAQAPFLPSRERLLSQWVGFLVFLAVACLFIDRRWTGYLTGLVALTGMAQLAWRREFDRTDVEFLLVVGLLPAAFLLNMLIHGFGSSIFGRPARLLIAYFAFYAIRRCAAQPMLFFDGCATGAIAAGLIAIYQVEWLGAERASADWNPVPFGNYSLLLGILVLCPLVAGSSRPLLRLAWHAGGVAMSGVALVLSATRGSWPAVPALLLLVTYARTGLSRRYRLAGATFVLVAAVGIGASSSSLQERAQLALHDAAAYVADPDSTAAQDTPFGLRLAMWSWGLEKFTQQPLAGIGLVNYHLHRQASVDKGEMPQQFLRMANVHNQLIHFLAVGGLLMAAALIAFWILAVRFFLRRLRAAGPEPGARVMPLAGLCIVIGTAIFSMSGSLFGTSPDSWAFAALLCMVAGFSAQSRDVGADARPA
jgi:O-antigen ligase